MFNFFLKHGFKLLKIFWIFQRNRNLCCTLKRTFQKNEKTKQMWNFIRVENGFVIIFFIRLNVFIIFVYILHNFGSTISRFHPKAIHQVHHTIDCLHSMILSTLFSNPSVQSPATISYNKTNTSNETDTTIRIVRDENNWEKPWTRFLEGEI